MRYVFNLLTSKYILLFMLYSIVFTFSIFNLFYDKIKYNGMHYLAPCLLLDCA